MDIFLTVVIFIVILSVLVLVHEAGHFFMARRVGIKVEEFGLGLPPKIWGIKRGETEYTINALPIGGFVRMYGETPDGVSVRDQATPDDADRMFVAKSKLARTAVLLAGVASNLLLGILIFTLVYTIGLPVFNYKPIIDQVSANSPAQQAGIKDGEQIIALNHTPFDQLQPSFTDVISQHPGQPVVLTLSQNGHQSDVTVTPRVHPPQGQGALGVTIMFQRYTDHLERYPIYIAGWVGIKEAVSFAGQILSSLGNIAGQFASHGTVPSDVAGPVGIAAILGQARMLGLTPLLWFAGIISINLAVVNVLPFPALDGGRLLFVIIEAVTRKKVNANIERWVHTIGMAVLLTLIVVLTYSDIHRLL